MNRPSAFDTARTPLSDYGVFRRLRGRRANDPESGMSLVLVVGSMLILAMVALTGLAYTLSSTKFSRRSQDYTGAMAAAQSGIEDVISRLNRNVAYTDTLDCANLAMVGPMTTTNACNYTAATAVGWLPVVAGETDPNGAYFHYAIDGTMSLVDGTVKVTATGKVNGQYRTIEATIVEGGSTDYVYYTDFESADPSNLQAYSTPASVPTACGGSVGSGGALYWYGGRNGCVEIQFGSGDYLDGPVFSNDAVLSSSAHFLKGFSSANPACNTVTANVSTWNNCLRQGSAADFNGVRPVYGEPRYLDDTSSGFAGFPGCHYFGATRIIFNVDGTMTVWNKTVNNAGAPPVAIAGPVGTPSCGTLTALDSAAGATVPVPDQMVIYTASALTSTYQTCNSGEIGGPTGRTLPLGTYNRAVHPGTLHAAYSYDTNMVDTGKRCQEGNLYAEGTVNGRVSLAASRSIIATGDLVLAGGRNGDDILGLIATNSVEIMHPVMATYTWQNLKSDCTLGSPSAFRYCGSNEKEANVAPYAYGTWPKRYQDPTTGSYSPATGIQIAGSIQTLQHSMFVQRYNVGPHKGVLNIFGSIAQRWRGIVGTTGTTGYNKLYEYDQRLTDKRPPYFPRWTNARWSLRYSGEITTPATVKGT